MYFTSVPLCCGVWKFPWHANTSRDNWENDSKEVLYEDLKWDKRINNSYVTRQTKTRFDDFEIELQCWKADRKFRQNVAWELSCEWWLERNVKWMWNVSSEIWRESARRFENVTGILGKNIDARIWCWCIYYLHTSRPIHYMRINFLLILQK